MSNPQLAFLDLLLAAFDDAAKEKKLTQLGIQFLPKGETKMAKVRVIVIPEEFKYKWPNYAPLGTPSS